MTTFTWAVTALYTETIADQQDYVVIANYILVGVDGEYEASISNTARFSTESVSEFIPYADLTEAIVVGWIQEELGVDGVANLEACVQGQIDSLINPPVAPVNTPLPWSIQ
jgi:hypothetical protein